MTAFAQVVLTQRSNVLHQFEHVHSSSPLQNLRDNEEKQMDRGYPVYSRRRTVWPWSSHVRSRCSAPRLALPLLGDVRVLELKENASTSYDTVYDSSGCVSLMFR